VIDSVRVAGHLGGGKKFVVWTLPLTAETPYGPRFQWLALDLQSLSRLG
jgi:hypothetical protein